jgi:transposase
MTKNIKPFYAQILQDKYPNLSHSVSDIAQELGLSIQTVRLYARMLKINRPKVKHSFPNKLSEEHEKLLAEHYEYGNAEELTQLMGKNRHAISELARKRGLKRKVVDVRKGDISPLLSKTIESFYWLGYLAADGYISTGGHLMFSQGEKDKESVYKFAEYVKSSVYEFTQNGGYKKAPYQTYRVNVLDPVIGKDIRALWGLSPGDKKTYSSINFFLEECSQCRAFLIGFFDGDGYLNSANGGKIEVHSSWFNFLVLLAAYAKMEGKTSINKRRYAELRLRKADMAALKAFGLEHNLPVNSRKWNF